MKTLVSRFFSLAVLMATLAAYGAKAQVAPAITFKAPGPFIAGNATFPAGTNTIRQEQDDLQVWDIFNDSKAYHAFISADPVDGTATSQKSEVTFHKYGDTLVLKQISISGLETGYIVETSYAEKKAAKNGIPTKVAVSAQGK